MTTEPELGCAVCGGPLPPPKGRRPRKVCNNQECLREANRYGAVILNIRKRRLDAGRLANRTHYQCPRCPEGTPAKPLGPEHFYVDKRAPDGEVVAWSRWCKECKREYQRARASEREIRERRIQANREKRARMAERRAADPELDAEIRAKNAANARRYRQRNKDRVREQNRRYQEKLRRDPARLKRDREQRRIAYRLRQEQQGLPLMVRRRKEGRESDRWRPTVPARPLAAAVDRIIEREQAGNLWDDLPVKAGDYSQHKTGVVCARFGITPRDLFAWRTGERERVHFDIADRVLTRSGLLWWEVWSPGSEGYEEARAAFEGDLSEAA